jgi:hypothetical protein
LNRLQVFASVIQRIKLEVLLADRPLGMPEFSSLRERRGSGFVFS